MQFFENSTKLSEIDIKNIEPFGVLNRFKEGEAISATNTIFVILEGKIKIFALHGDKKKTLAYLDKGEFFGEMSLSEDSDTTVCALALSAAVLLAVPRKSFKKAVISYPELSFQFLKILSNKLRQADSEIESLAFGSALSRIAKILFGFCQKYGEKTDKGILIKLNLSHQDLAELSGSVREVVSRTLSKFYKLEILSASNGNILVKDIDKLKLTITQGS